MPSPHRIPICLQLVVALILLLVCFPASAQQALPENARTVMPENKVPGQVESTARQLMHQLDKHGYEVLRGYFKLFTADDCELSYEVMHTCYGNNPAAPYVLPVVPPWPVHPGPAEWVDPATIGALGNAADGYSVSYRLDPHEALVILAQMPPPAAFFGMKTYLFTRDGGLCTDSTQYRFVESRIPALFPVFFSIVPNEPPSTPRAEIIADLSNSPNNVIIANQSGSVWNQLRYFIITPNPMLDAAIRDAFGKIGIPDQNVFTEKIPGYIEAEPVVPQPSCPDAAALRFGLGQQADDFVTVIRYAMPVDGTAAENWRHRLPMVVLRIRNLEAEEESYAWEDFDSRTPSEPSEVSYQPDLEALTGAVCASWNKSETTQDCSQWKKMINMQAAPLLLTGPACVPAWMNCIAPSEDSTYQMTAKLPLDPDHFYAVVGPLSTATGNATYVGLGLNMSVNQWGFDNISDDRLVGSATGYSNDVPSDKFFVQYFARDCTALAGQSPAGVSFNCYSVGDKLPYCNDAADLKCNMLVLSLRGYIRPGTQRATDKSSVLNSRYILLKVPKP